MANSLLRFKQRFPANSILSNVLQESSTEIHVTPKCRNLMSIAINTDAIPDVSLAHETCRRDDRPHHLNPQILKEKEKGDWRFLTMEEKKHLYHMSISQPCEIAPADEWKTILASTFTAMGLITMGIYFWLTKHDMHQFKQPPLIATAFPEQHDQLEGFFGDKTENTLFDSQARH